MNTKKLLGMIIAVLAFAALIAGATFAFFSASGGSANNAITVNATTLSNLGFTSSNSKIATNLVPVRSESPYFFRYPGTSASGCIDDVGNEICTVYEFTITNTASVAQTIYVSLVPSQNTYDNLYFAAFNTTAASANYIVATGSNGTGNNFTLTAQTTASNSTLAHVATKLTKNSSASINMPGLSTSLGGGASVTYTVLVWLQDIGTNQNQEQGGTFKAGINVTTGDSSTGVTGQLSNYVYTFPKTTASIGSTIPFGVTKYSSGSAVMADNHNWPMYIIYKTENNIITEHYVEFVVTSAMATANQGMIAGTYTLKEPYNSDSQYTNNVNIIETAFGYTTNPSRCTVSSSSVTCSVSGLKALIQNDEIYVDNYDWRCLANKYGRSTCYQS